MTSVAMSDQPYDPIKRADEIIEQLRRREIKFNSKNLKYRMERINHFLAVKLDYEGTKTNPYLNDMTKDYAGLLLNAYDILVANNIVEGKDMILDNEQRALAIVKQIQDREIIISPNADLWISDEIADILKRYRNRDVEPLNKAFVDRVFTIYEIIVSRGLTEKNANLENEELKKEILALRKRLQDMEFTDKPDDTFRSEVKEEDD